MRVFMVGVIFVIYILSFMSICFDHYRLNSKISETKALILEYQSKLTAVETEKQKTIADFLRSVKTGGGKMDGVLR